MKKSFKHKFKQIASERIKNLFELAGSVFKESPELSSRYLQIARNISTKHKVGFTKDQKFVYCKVCGSYLKPGINAKIRVSKSKLVITCSCGALRRIPLK
ncbi:MAG: ribonuclease P protein component 4 [Candidatus Woesearchaeota archaeon]